MMDYLQKEMWNLMLCKISMPIGTTLFLAIKACDKTVEETLKAAYNSLHGHSERKLFQRSMQK